MCEKKTHFQAATAAWQAIEEAIGGDPWALPDPDTHPLAETFIKEATAWIKELYGDKADAHLADEKQDTMYHTLSICVFG